MSTRGSIETRIVKYFKEADIEMVDVMHEALGRIVAGRKRDAKAGGAKPRKARRTKAQMNGTPEPTSVKENSNG
jgi:hypothetical protein